MNLWSLLKATVVGAVLSVSVNASAQDPGGAGTGSAICENANLFTNVFNDVCWDCFLDNLTLFGVGNPPNGAADNGPVCSCTDSLGVPEIGYPLSMWQPQRVVEVTTIPWCSVGLGGVRLQNSLKGSGFSNEAPTDNSRETKGFYQYHYFSYPIMMMLDMFIVPSCHTDYIDFDLMYISEIDPLHQNDLLAIMLNPEAIIFSNPIATAYCAYDCVQVTADNAQESAFPCAGCDGNLYPLTGNVYPQPDPVAASSLIAQRALAGLHRKGLAKKTIGDAAMCDPEYAPMTPRSQYRFSMLHPVPEASSGGAMDVVSGAESIGELAGSATGPDAFGECCHPMGMSTARWCVPAGGRKRPGRDTNYMYLIWNYRDCCIRG